MSQEKSRHEQFWEELAAIPVYKLPDDCLWYFQPHDDNFHQINRIPDKVVDFRIPHKSELLPYSR